MDLQTLTILKTQQGTASQYFNRPTRLLEKQSSVPTELSSDVIVKKINYNLYVKRVLRSSIKTHVDDASATSALRLG